MIDMNNPADSSVKDRAINEGCEAGNSKLDDQVALNELSYGEQFPLLVIPLTPSVVNSTTM